MNPCLSSLVRAVKSLIKTPKTKQKDFFKGDSDKGGEL